jgi:hypothetical protein
VAKKAKNDHKAKKKELETVKANVERLNGEYQEKNSIYQERQEELSRITGGVYSSSVASKEQSSRSPRIPQDMKMVI